MSKTNPLPPKEKAVDLKDHYPLIGSLNKVIEKKSKILTRLIGVNEQDQEQYLRMAKAQSSLTHEDERNRYQDHHQRFVHFDANQYQMAKLRQDFLIKNQKIQLTGGWNPNMMSQK